MSKRKTKRKQSEIDKLKKRVKRVERRVDDIGAALGAVAAKAADLLRVRDTGDSSPWSGTTLNMLLGQLKEMLEQQQGLMPRPRA